MTTKKESKPRQLKRVTRVKKMNNLYAEILSTVKTALEKAILIGELLVEQKEKIDHKKWGKWVDDNVDFSQRTASRYMNLYKNKEEVQNAGSVREALKLLSSNAKVVAKTKTDTRDRFKVTVNKDAPEELAKKLSEKCSKEFLSQIVEHIQRLSEESEQND